MAEPTPSEVLVRKRKLQRACDICRRRKGQSFIRTEETPRPIIIPLAPPHSTLYVHSTLFTRVLTFGTYWHLVICCHNFHIPLSL